jgi:hypothetical protein
LLFFIGAEGFRNINPKYHGRQPNIASYNETWSRTLREEHRLRVFEIRVLKGIFGPERDEATGGWRKLKNERLYNLYS